MSTIHERANTLLNEAYRAAQHMLDGSTDFQPFALVLRRDGSTGIVQGVDDTVAPNNPLTERSPARSHASPSRAC